MAQSFRRMRVLGSSADIVWRSAPSPFPMPRRLPVVVTVHDVQCRVAPEEYGRFQNLYRRAGMFSSLRTATSTLCDSARTAADVVRWYPGTPSPVTCPLSGSHMLQLQGSQKAGPAGSSDSLTAVIVGHAANKNVEQVLELMTPPGRFRPVVLCGSESRVAAMRSWIATSPDVAAHGAVELLGPLDDGAYASVVGQADVLVMLSRFEGFGLPVAEALALGVPVLTSRDPALLELVGDNGRCVGLDVSRAEFMKALREAVQLSVVPPRRSWADVARETHRTLAEAARRDEVGR